MIGEWPRLHQEFGGGGGTESTEIGSADTGNGLDRWGYLSKGEDESEQNYREDTEQP